MFGHYIRSNDGSCILNYVKLMNVCGIFRALLNFFFANLMAFNKNISCKHVNIEF